MRKILLSLICSLASAVAMAQIGAITGPATVCTGSAITLSDTTAGGTWSSSNVARATVGYTSGVVTGVSSGGVTMTYTTSSGFVTRTVLVNPFPFAIGGAISVCVGKSITLSDSIPGGVWSVTNANATMSGNVFNGVTSGVDTVLYTVAYSCGNAVSKKAITIHALPDVGPISGNASLCVGAYDTLVDTNAGGLWKSSDNSAATVTSHGLVKGITAAAGVVITHTTSNDYCSASATINVAVIGLPTVGPITGGTSVCVAGIDTLKDTTTVGTWSTFNSNVSVSPHGVILGINPGVDTVYFTKTTGCGAFSKKKAITVNALPISGILTAPKDSLCVGDTLHITASETGGYWTRTNSKASIFGTGNVVGVGAGLDTVKYTVTSTAGCGTALSEFPFKVNPLPTAASISGTTAYCIGQGDSMKNTTKGGIWGVTNGNCTIGASGYLKCLGAGNDTVTYTVTNSCGSILKTRPVTVHPNPYAGVIKDTVNAVCIGSKIYLTDSIAGGYWMKANANASVSGGVVTGLLAGKDTIEYQVTSPYGCGKDTARFPIVVEATPQAGAISGPTTLCVGSQYSMKETVSTGVWNCTNSGASIDGGGQITPFFPGLDTVTYSVASLYCGTAVAIHPVVIQSQASCEDAVRAVAATEEAIAIFPNPNNSNTLTVHVGRQPSTVAVAFVNTVGQVVLTANIDAAESAIDIAMLPKGYYTVVFTNGRARIGALKLMRI